MSDSEKSLTKNTCHPELVSGSIHLIGKSTIIDSGSESGMTVKEYKNTCHPEALAEGSQANVITPTSKSKISVLPRGEDMSMHVILSDSEGATHVDTLPTHAKETSTTAEGTVANSSCPPLVQTGIEVSSTEVCSEPTCVAPEIDEFRGGQLFGRDSSVTAFPQNDCKKKKAGFTLAEVLITLGIIGVVAAMTIPNLIANVKGHQYRSQFKKTLSTLSQAALLSQEQYGFNFESAGGCMNFDDHPESIQSLCALLNGTISGGTHLSTDSDFSGDYFRKVNDINGGTMLSESMGLYQLPDGSILIISEPSGSCTWNAALTSEDNYTNLSDNGCTGFIDVNGFTLPNKLVKCSSGTTKFNTTDTCTVKNKDMSDIFPVVFYDSTVVPQSNAARYVLNTAK